MGDRKQILAILDDCLRNFAVIVADGLATDAEDALRRAERLVTKRARKNDWHRVRQPQFPD